MIKFKSKRDIPVKFFQDAFEDRDGVLYWKNRPREHFSTDSEWENWNSKRVGTLVSQKPNANHLYSQIRFFNHTIIRHYIIWVLHTNEHPTALPRIKHNDNDRSNDRFDNLSKIER